jgi:hypothetical protein
VSHYAIVFGGSNNEVALNDTWALDLGEGRAWRSSFALSLFGGCFF